MTGAQLRTFRLAAGRSQGDLAREMGCSRVLVARLELDEDPIGLGRAYRIALALGLNPHSLDPRLVDRPPGKAKGNPPAITIGMAAAPMIRKALLRDQTPRERTVEPDDYSQDHPDD